MSRTRSSSTPAIILKRLNTGETDRIVTLLTPDQGKLVCVAKGSRKMTSTKRAYLEPGNLITAYLIQTKSLPLLTQAKLIADHAHCKQSLVKMRQLSQVLEIADRLFAEGVAEPELYHQLLHILKNLSQPDSHLGSVKQQLSELVAQFGFSQISDHQPDQSLLDLVATISEKPMRSWDYLTIR